MWYFCKRFYVTIPSAINILQIIKWIEEYLRCLSAFSGEFYIYWSHELMELKLYLKWISGLVVILLLFIFCLFHKFLIILYWYNHSSHITILNQLYKLLLYKIALIFPCPIYIAIKGSQSWSLTICGRLQWYPFTFIYGVGTYIPPTYFYKIFLYTLYLCTT